MVTAKGSQAWRDPGIWHQKYFFKSPQQGQARPAPNEGLHKLHIYTHETRLGFCSWVQLDHSCCVSLTSGMSTPSLSRQLN